MKPATWRKRVYDPGVDDGIFYDVEVGPLELTVEPMGEGWWAYCFDVRCDVLGDARSGGTRPKLSAAKVAAIGLAESYLRELTASLRALKARSQARVRRKSKQS